MSRSYKKTPVFGICGHTSRSSEKEDKRLANRHLRHWANQELKEWGEDAILPIMEEASSIWSFKHDGKHYREYVYDRGNYNVEFWINPHHNFRHDDSQYLKTYKPSAMRK